MSAKVTALFSQSAAEANILHLRCICEFDGHAGREKSSFFTSSRRKIDLARRMECFLNSLNPSAVRSQGKALANGRQLLGDDWASILPITFRQISQISVAANFAKNYSSMLLSYWCKSQLKVGQVKTCPPRRAFFPVFS